MRKHSIVVASMGAFLAAALVGACDNPVSKLPPRPSVPFVLGIDISGPDTIAPGESVQYTATVRLSDGTRKAAADVSGAQWTSSNPTVLRVSSSGLVTAQQQLNETTLRLRMSNPANARGAFLQSTKEIVVVPTGTFRVVGKVSDEVPTAPLASARVEVTTSNVVAMTNFFGEYRLYGVPADAEIRVTHDGYETIVQPLQLTSHVKQDFQLKPAAPRIALNGPYRIEIEASGCAGLTSELRRRQYDAVVTQNGPVVEVVLTNPQFRAVASGRGDRFSGRVEPTSATFTLEPYYYYYYYYYGPSSYPSVAERLSNGTYLVTEGTVIATGSAARLSGPLTGGGLFNWDSRFPDFGFLLQNCTNPQPTLTLTPR